MSLPFDFRAVSNAVGAIRINTADELTYFAEGSPKLANATVTLRDYFSNEVVASAVTDSTGFVDFSNIKEGNYNLEIKADKHETFRQTVQLGAGEVENVNAFLSRQTVRYIWTVTPTEVQDKYIISVESLFETNVPVPTLTIDPPQIDLAGLDVVGEETQIDMTITNHGLIAANNIKLNFGEHPFYKIEPLIKDAGTVSAMGSLTIPVKITRIADFTTLNSSAGEIQTLSSAQVLCSLLASVTGDYPCGGQNVGISIGIAVNGVEGNSCGPIQVNSNTVIQQSSCSPPDCDDKDKKVELTLDWNGKLGDIVTVNFQDKLEELKNTSCPDSDTKFKGFTDANITDGKDRIAQYDNEKWKNDLKDGIIRFIPRLSDQGTFSLPSILEYGKDFPSSTGKIVLDDGKYKLTINLNLQPGYTSLGATLPSGLSTDVVTFGSSQLDKYRQEQRLAYLGFPAQSGLRLDVNGKDDGDELGWAIDLFDGIANNKRMIEPANGKFTGLPLNNKFDTSKGKNFLNATNAPRWNELKPSTIPNISIDKDQDERWATNWTLQILQSAANSYNEKLTTTALTRKAGGIRLPHSGHQTGLDIDIDVIDIGASGYSAQSVIDLIKIFFNTKINGIEIKRAIFNDKVVQNAFPKGKVISAVGHDNHVHFDVSAPSPQFSIQSLNLDNISTQTLQLDTNNSISPAQEPIIFSQDSEINNIIDLAVLSDNLTLTDSISSNTSDVYYRFVLGNNAPDEQEVESDVPSFPNLKNFNLSLHQLSSNVDVALVQDLNDDGLIQDDEIIASSKSTGNSDETINLNDLPEGVYYIHLLSKEGSANYTLDLSLPPLPIPLDKAGNTLATALDLGVLNNPITQTDFIGEVDTDDYYRFSLTSLSDLALSVTDLSLGDVSVTLGQDLNNNGTIDDNEIIAISDEELDSPEQINLTNLLPGNYFIGISRNSGNTNYILKLAATSLEQGDNSPKGAYNIGLLTQTFKRSDFIGDTDKQDYYRFFLNKNSPVTIKLDGLSADAILELSQDRNNDGYISSDEIIAWSDVPGSSPENLTFDNLQAGNYLVRVYQFEDDTNYNLTIDIPETKKDNDQNNGSCAKVSIKIDQEAVMTGSAFLGKLEIDNGNETNLTNLTVTLQVKDAQGNIVNSLFGVTKPTLKNINAVDGTGILTGDNPATPENEGIGSAEWTFLPTTLAAPDVPTQYTIGGTLSYTDNGTVISVPLVAAPVTVYPQAQLYLDYFQQRDVFADDPFTDKIEPSEPFDLGMILKNKGKGSAKDLEITSSQPKIVDNEKGLLVDFKVVGTQVGTESISPSLTLNFGTIAPNQITVANWLFTSTIQGKFTDYKASFKHINDLGIPELSIIKDVKIHELIHKVRVTSPTDDQLPDFLVNDLPDANFTPDTLYLSDGTTAPVKSYSNATTDGAATLDDLTVQISATLDKGWSYLTLNDPANGQFQIKKVLRADGTEVALDNVWTTDRTFPATGRPIYENILHLLDNNPTAGAQTYTITYTTGNQNPPKVQDIVDVTPNPRNIPVNTLDVVFTQPIKTATFDPSDITLTLDGVAVNTSSLTITPVNTNTYRIGNLESITGNVGQYQLSVNAGGVQDFEGLSGTGIVNESWVFTGNKPAVDSITGFASNLLKAPVNTVTVTFTEAINPSTFDFNDLFLNRDGGGNLIDNTVTITQINPTTYQINNLGNLTNIDGIYSLLVKAQDINDTDGNTGVGAKGFNWTLDTNAPKLLSITDVTSPRNTKVSTLDIAFSKPIDPTTFDLSDLILTLDGKTNAIANSASLTKLTDTTYRLNGLTAAQATDGTYTLAIAGNGIKDSAGNTVTNSLSQNWTLDTTAPNAPTNIQATANLAPSIASLSVNTATSLGVLNEFGQIRVNSTKLIITGSLAETGLNVYVKDKTLNQSLGQATVNGTNFNSQVQLSGSGARDLEIQVVDAAGNTTTSPLSLFADITPPTLVKFTNIPQTPVTNPINAIEVEFSEIINLSTFDYQDITLTRDGGSNLITNAVTIEYLSGNTYRINGLGSLTQALGNYTLQINTTGLQDQAGNQGIEPKNATFTIQSPSTPGVTITQSNGSTNVTEGGATDSYTVVLRTQPTADVTINLAIGNQITTNKTTLTFTTSNWNLPQTITVTAVDDKITEGTQTNTITHTTSSSDSNYNSLTIPTVNVGIQDNDAEVRGIIWNDINGNGVRDNSEPTLSGWKVYLDSNNNNLLDTGEVSTTSDAQGAYTFNNLRPNTYAIAQVVQDGYKQTYPVINISTTASTEKIFTPSDILSTSSNTQNTSATHLINLDGFQSDPRFANIKGQSYSTVIIDTGIDLDNPLFGADSDRNGIADKIIYEYDFADQDTDASDKNGHGSNIASIAASVASDANIIALKVFKDNGSGYFSDLEAALQWVNQNAQKYNIASVNLSLGDGQNWNTGNPRYGIGDELAAIASQNIIIAAAAGNSFYEFNNNPGLAYPAADPNTISVGAVWADNFGTNKSFSGGAIDYTTDSDRIASFSQRSADQLDVFAPGIFITGANATGGTQSMGGTSQATPFISGLAVLAHQIAQEKLNRKLTLGEFRTLLDTTSILINDGDNENDNVKNTGKNFPRVNALALAEGILKLNNQVSSTDNSNSNTNSTNNPLYLPSGSVKLTHTVTLTSGQTATDINFGNQLLNNAPTLGNAIADQNAKQSNAFNFQIPTNTFTDIDAGDVLNYSATLENGNALPNWLTFDAKNSTFSGTPNNDNVGNLSVKVAATDKAGSNVSDIFVIAVENVNDAPIVANLIADQNAKQGTAFNFQISTNTFTDIDAGDVLTYSATLENGAALPNWLTFNSTTRTFSGTPTNDNVGNLNVKAIATDTAGVTVSDIFTITVENVNDAPVLSNALVDQNAKQGTAFNFQIPTNTFTDIDTGDVLTYSATLENGNALPSWLTFNSVTRTFSGTPTNDNVGSLNVKVTATDKAGVNVSDIFTVTVENLALASLLW
ncbi:putative Ig domain-containing protein [Dolichospermum sp. LEGE 00246]|uniref:putative Ig domain-containing protein n=1 Tax=Dolichospermum sp. LEGE 00246 TaxID=1828605 RepID=UPI001881E37D|nr:putative Ig domain-containing protein [Dolichospermum sp. LEGE 00246]MBE9257518.1 putative Ig domain-containing protein [Dolichospermum sp. LEGE 00246]